MMITANIRELFVVFGWGNGMEWITIEGNDASGLEDLKEKNELLQIFHDKIWEENGYHGEWSIPCQNGRFKFRWLGM